MTTKNLKSQHFFHLYLGLHSTSTIRPFNTEINTEMLESQDNAHLRYSIDFHSDQVLSLHKVRNVYY